MTSMSIAQVASQIDASIVGEDVMFSSVSTDTRDISRGDLFVALQGDNFDGHDYVGQAAEKGAVAAMVSRSVSEGIPQIVVEDTRMGLGQLATVWRNLVNPKVVALTGSNGKTTLKEMLAAILSEKYEVLATLGNLNNDIGVPLTLLRLQQEEVAIVEMGANHVGEIDYLSRMALPDVAILNNAGRAHIGEFGSEEAIARGKAEILNGLQQQGIFIYNADSKWVSLWNELAEGINKVGFGTASDADYQGLLDGYRMHWDDCGYQAEFSVHEKKTSQNFLIRISLAGLHNCMNALAAIAAARELGIEIEFIQKGLARLQPVVGRLKPMSGDKGQLIIDDAYNANPDSVAAAIDVLVTAPGRKIFVLGDLAELGESEVEMHAQLGELAYSRGVDVLYTCGPLSQAASVNFAGETYHFDERDQLIKSLQQDTGNNDFILVKGSRSAAMDKVVAALTSGGVAC